MTSDEIRIVKNGQATLSGHEVGVSDIWERELADEKGVSLPRMSASLSILEIATGNERRDVAFAGSVIALGADRYCTTRVEPGKGGGVTLRKLQP